MSSYAGEGDGEAAKFVFMLECEKQLSHTKMMMQSADDDTINKVTII